MEKVTFYSRDEPVNEIGGVYVTGKDGARTEKVVKFTAGKFTTSDPEIIAQLTALAEGPSHPITKKEV